MQPFSVATALAVPLRRANVDTDAIIPKQYLKRIERTGYGQFLFDEWRHVYADSDQLNPEFVLNFPRYQGAKLLLAGENFGCGSSREHAPWALMDYGFQAVIAPSFADIFYTNSLKNGLLPAVVAAPDVEALMAEVEANEGCQLTVDLREQKITSPAGLSISFEINPDARHSLLEGLDEIGLTLKHDAEISAFEQARTKGQPWV